MRQKEECKAIVSWSIKVGDIDFLPLLNLFMGTELALISAWPYEAAHLSSEAIAV